MSQAGHAATRGQQIESPQGGSRRWIYGLLAVSLLPVSVALTDPPFIGDSFAYCNDVALVLQHQAAPSTLWEPGHILWRPLAWLFSPLFLSTIPDSVAWTPALKIGCGLLLLNLLCGMLCAFWIYDLSRRQMGDWAALIPVCLFVWGDAVLAYSQSSTPYIVGFALLMTGIWWQLHSSQRPQIGPAILFGFSALFWLPYVVAIPAACCVPRFVDTSAETRGSVTWRGIFAAACVSGSIVAAGIGLATMLANVHSLQQFVAWLEASGHGMRQTRQGMRIITGCSRLFVDLGNAGVYLKRFLFHDPYHPVGALSTVAHSLAKPALFYVFLAAVLLPAWFSGSGRRSLQLLAVAALPAVFVAVFIFEPSSAERFLPVLPFLLLTIAAAWNGRWRFAGAARVVICVFALSLPLLNAPTFVEGLSGWHQQVASQVAEFRANASNDDAFVGILSSEAILDLPTEHPFDSLNRAGDIFGMWAVGLMDAQVQEWPSHVARFVLKNWDQGKSVWTEKAAVADRPPDQLLWVEGDNPKVHWRDVSSFFRELEFDRVSHGRGEFLRIAHTPGNEQLFHRLAN